jgi:hypothetical protein
VCRVKGLLLERQQLHVRCVELEACNARLMRQLSATLRALQTERATSQAEVARLRQKVTPCRNKAPCMTSSLQLTVDSACACSCTVSALSYLLHSWCKEVVALLG